MIIFVFAHHNNNSSSTTTTTTTNINNNDAHLHKLSSLCFIPIQLARSNEYTVALRSVRSISGGVYRCEVSGDAPLFHTETRAAKMLIAQLPDYNPTVKIYDTSDNEYKKSVTIGDRIRAHCISGPSHPTVNFTWSINGVRLPVNFFDFLTIFSFLVSMSFSSNQS